MNETTSKGPVPKLAEALTAAIASGGIYLLAWCYEYGYAAYFQLPWPAPVVLSRYCAVFVFVAMLMALACFIPQGSLGDSPWRLNRWNWWAKVQAAGMLLLMGWSIGFLVGRGIEPSTVTMSLIFGVMIPGFWLGRRALNSRYTPHARASFAGCATCMLCFAAFLIGAFVPTHFQNWPTFQDDAGHTWVIVELHEGDLVTAKLNESTKRYSPEFTIMTASDCPPIVRKKIVGLRPE